MINLNWFSCSSSILVKLEFRDAVLVEDEKPENPDKNPWGKAKADNKLYSHRALGRNWTWATFLVINSPHVPFLLQHKGPGPLWWKASALATVPSLLHGEPEWFLIGCFKTRVITLANHKGFRHFQVNVCCWLEACVSLLVLVLLGVIGLQSW